MENQIFGQSCAMPMNIPDDYGTEQDGSKSSDYCRYCYENGSFLQDSTMGEMIETVFPFAKISMDRKRLPEKRCLNTSPR